jgi:hypothetical protein
MRKFGLLSKLKNDRRGFIETIIAVGIGVMVLIAVVLAVSYFSDAIPEVSDPVANETITNTIGIGFNALSILGIAILISAVVAIIVVIMGAFGYGVGGGGRR